jgi:hypothetical protein
VVEAADALGEAAVVALGHSITRAASELRDRLAQAAT